MLTIDLFFSSRNVEKENFLGWKEAARYITALRRKTKGPTVLICLTAHVQQIDF